ncbi:NUDIX hydrolase [Aeromonas sp. ASNIH2]|uniref:NUDIX hydrolase n=1 Tax=Aeromonas sp. ASNIH2 TaxID=1636607 RepID=UPI000CDBB9A6|nr:NUDIX domain-containing protein [Aeromonas sp. ASNIH2]AUY10660.1 NUDIX pyrophosphatase [Aeromonas sp. ASNIH2]
MRTAKQVLVIPYFIRDAVLQMVILKRADLDIWQWVAGGVEENESLDEAARRECSEELGIACCDNPLLPLESHCTIPKSHFDLQGAAYEHLYTITEYAFAIELKVSDKIALSEEHSEHMFTTYPQLKDLKIWDSNRTAAWELRQRLLDNHLIVA